MKKRLYLPLLLAVLAAVGFSSCDLLPSEQKPNMEQTTVGTEQKSLSDTEANVPADTKEQTVACNHSYGEWSVEKPATCKETGKQIRTCSTCGAKETQSIPTADEHTEVENTPIAATCKETGLTGGTHCSVCDLALTSPTVTPISNMHTIITDAAIPATCQHTGLTEGSHCKICGQIDIPQTEIPMLSHIFENHKCLTCDTYTPSTGLNLELDTQNNQYIVLGMGSCTDSRIVIPEQIDGIPVSRIERNAFMNTSGFFEIVIPDSIKVIASGAFQNSTVESVILPKDLDKIPNDCFKNCVNLKSINLPDNIYTIGEHAFYNCKNLPEAIIFPKRLQYINAYAFENCTSIKTMTFSDRLIEIRHDAFTNVKFEKIKYDGSSYTWQKIVQNGWCSGYQNYLLVCSNGSF